MKLAITGRRSILKAFLAKRERTKNEIEEILELFCPVLDQDKTNRFYALVNRISQAYPNYRAQIIRQELDGFAAQDENVEDMKYKAKQSSRR